MWSLLIGKFQKGACRYLLHRYLGQYLREKVTVDQLTVDLYNGTGSVKDVNLDCEVRERRFILVKLLFVQYYNRGPFFFYRP